MFCFLWPWRLIFFLVFCSRTIWLMLLLGVVLPLPGGPVRPTVSPGATAVLQFDLRVDAGTPTGTLIVHWPIDALPQSVEWLRALTR